MFGQKFPDTILEYKPCLKNGSIELESDPTIVFSVPELSSILATNNFCSNVQRLRRLLNRDIRRLVELNVR